MKHTFINFVNYNWEHPHKYIDKLERGYHK